MMERRWQATNHAALGVLLAAFGCAAGPPGISLDDDGDTGGEGDTGEPTDIPFELVSANFDATGQFVTLSFSEPVAPVDGVDPSDFRISFSAAAVVCDESGDCVEQTSYWDPNFFAAPLPYPPTYGEQRFDTDLITNGSQATDVILRFAMPLDPRLCPYVTLSPYALEDDYLFVHHASGDIPVKSADGESLASFGPQWVEYGSPVPVWSTEGEFPNLDPKVPIPCSS